MRFKPFGIVMTACLVAASCASEPESRDNIPVAEPTVVQPQVAKSDEQKAADRILVSKGVIKSDNEIPVYSRITGQLNAVRLIDGQTVRKGTYSSLLMTRSSRQRWSFAKRNSNRRSC